LVNRFLSEVCLVDKEKSSLSGYAKKHLGEFGEKTMTFSVVFGITGAMLAYVIMGGIFLNSLLGFLLGGSEFIYSFIFFALGALGVLFSVRAMGKGEIVMAFLLVLVILIIFFAGIPLINTNNFSYISWNNFFVPYGVILFALLGASIIPELSCVVNKNPKDLRKVIFFGSFLPVFLYILFNVVVVGITGGNTTAEAISGLGSIMGNWVGLLGSFFGLLAVFTSFLGLGFSLRSIYEYDYKIPKLPSWFLVVSVPFIAFLIGARSFIPIISLAGVVMGGIEGILIVLIFRKVVRKFKEKMPYSWAIKVPLFIHWFVILIFILGIVLEIFYAISLK